MRRRRQQGPDSAVEGKLDAIEREGRAFGEEPERTADAAQRAIEVGRQRGDGGVPRRRT